MGTSSSFDSTTSDQGYLRREVSLPGKWAYLYSDDFRPLTVLCLSARGALARIDEALVPNRELRFQLPLSEEFEFQANATIKNQSGELVDLEFNKRDLTAALRINAYVAFPQWARNKKPDDKMSLLVIHPDVQAADALEKYLTSKAYEVDVALGVNAGWELGKSFQHDLTLVTSRVGLKTAFSLCQKLVGEKLSPVLWIQENQDVDSELLILSGACAAIRKPFTLEQLHRAIRGLSTFFHSLIVLPPTDEAIRAERRAVFTEPAIAAPRRVHVEPARSRPSESVEIAPAKPAVFPSEPPAGRLGASESSAASETGKPAAPPGQTKHQRESPMSVTTLVATEAERAVPGAPFTPPSATPVEHPKPLQPTATAAESPVSWEPSASMTPPRVTKPTSYTAVLARDSEEKFRFSLSRWRWMAGAAAGIIVLGLGGWYAHSRLSMPKAPVVEQVNPAPPASSLEVSQPKPPTPLTGLSAIGKDREEARALPAANATSAQSSASPTTLGKTTKAIQTSTEKQPDQTAPANPEQDATDSSPKPVVIMENLEKFKLRIPAGSQAGRSSTAPETALPLVGGTPSSPAPMISTPSLPEPAPPAVEVEAKAIKRVDPILPLSAKQYRGTFEVVVVATIDETGKITEAHALRKDNYGFGQAAVDAVKRWAFSPATRNEEPIPTTQAIRFVFRGKGF